MSHRQSGRQRYGLDSPHIIDSRHSSLSDIFSDTHALNPAEVPPAPSPAGEADPLAAAFLESSSARRSLSLHPSLQSRWSSLRRSDSSHRVAKRGSVSSRRDGSLTASANLPGTSSDHETVSLSSTPRRMTSNASSYFVPRAQSPYHGATGPSHPYAMYRQDIGVGRTPSNATTSTTRTPLRSYTGPSGPSHPYGMYAQNTVSEDDVTAGADINPAAPPGLAPLGFNGAGHRYQRRLGPDGEDADDIIGPDGHTEQLPPYTRYANDLPPEEDPIQPIGNTGNAHDPFADPQIALNTSPTEYVNNTDTIPGIVPTLIDPAPETQRSVNEGGHYKETISARSKKRKCGVVPVWLIAVAVSILAAVVVGCVVGAFIRRHHDHHQPQESAQQEQVAARPSSTAAPTVTTSWIDANLMMSTPSSLPSAPTGSFSLSMTNSSNSACNCLSNTSPNNAWACAKSLEITLQVCLTPNGPQAQILPPATSQYRYGPQPPRMSRPADLRLATEKGDQYMGLAFFFQQRYDKVVVIRDSEFANENSKRSSDNVFGGYEVGEIEERHGPQQDFVSSTDRPWFCIWNNTAIEGFIYINEDISSATSTQSAPAAASSSAAFQSSGFSIPEDPVFTGAISQVTAVPTTYGTKRKRQDIDLTFSKIFKLEEVRGPRQKLAYCQQMDMSQNKPSPLPGKNRTLEEDESNEKAQVFHPGSRPTLRGRHDKGASKKNIVRDFDSLESSCRCEWLNS